MTRLYCAIKLLFKNKIKTILLVLCLSYMVGQAQKEDRVWCFPDHAGIDFNNLANPDTFSSAIGTPAHENNSTIADSSGALFCYASATDFTFPGAIIMA
ncbi:MAG: hypothetical protein NT126_10835 [Bacteroidetes bacterium]|nr:hypothetical protein [Bacteroidota bacterium]